MAIGPEVDLGELRAALDRVLSAVEERFGPTLDLAADHYWTLDPRRAFDPHAEQSVGLMVSQLSDDIQELRSVVTRPDDPVIWHDLSHIVGILSRIAAIDLSGETAD
jgi:hypothetical protein